jgi:hypothetical protein
MRKLSLTAALLAACAVCLVAQEAPGASVSTGFLDTNTYANYFSSAKMRDGRRIIPDKYLNPVSDDDFYRFSVLSKVTDDIDTDLEFILLSYYSQPVVNIRPIEAQNMLPANNPRAAGLKLGSAVLKEMAELQFLDPSITAATGRYEGMLRFISDRNGVSRADIENYYRQGIGALIAETVNAEFAGKSVPSATVSHIKQTLANFYINPNQTSFDSLKRIYRAVDGIDGKQRNYGLTNALLELGRDRGWTRDKLNETAALVRAMREELDRALRDLNTTYAASSNSTWAGADWAYRNVLSSLSPALATKVRER